MIKEAPIVNLLYEWLELFDNDLPISWPGVPFMPPLSGGYLIASINPNAKRTPFFANDDASIASGLLQVTIVMPAQSSENAMRQIADSICFHFARGTYLIDNVASVKIYDEPSTSPVLQDGLWHRLPVTIRYISY